MAEPILNRLHRRQWLNQAGHCSAALLATSVASHLPVNAQDSSTKSSDPKIKVGQVGVKHAHASKLSVYRSSPDYEVVGVVEPDVKAREAAESNVAFRGVRWMSEEELLGTPGLQVVLVETHVRDGLAAAARAVAASKHVHLDKPAGNDLATYKKLLADARERKLMVQMGYMYRYNPAIVLLRKFLAEGWLGDVFEVDAVAGKVVDDAERKALTEFQGGMMFELGCHVMDLVVGVLGRIDKVTPYHRHVGAQRDGLRDNMMAVLETERAIATVRASAVEVDGSSRRHLLVCGTRGSFHIQPLDNLSRATITLSTAHGEYQAGTHTHSFPKFTRYSADAADMARILRGEKASDFSYEHDLEVQRCLLAACE